MPFPLEEAPEALRKLMAEIGPRWAQDQRRHVEMTLDAYAALLAGATDEGVQVTRDLAYGEHPRQALDVFRPSGATRAPVVVFVHGGAFVRGDKRVRPGIYDNVLRYFARHGLVGVNVGYRLAPEATFPEGARDVARAMVWIEHEIAAYGGDPQRIFLFGNSAGGSHVATYAFDRTAVPERSAALAGIVLASARVRAAALPDDPNADAVRAYFGSDASLHEPRSPVTHADDPDLPVFIAIAEYENAYLDVYAAELLHKLSRHRKRAPRFLRLTRHNHISLIAHFDTGEEILGREILDFIARDC